MYPAVRLRRLRMQPVLRELFQEVTVTKRDLVHLCQWARAGDAEDAAASAARGGLHGVYIEGAPMDEAAAAAAALGKESFAVMVDVAGSTVEGAVTVAKAGAAVLAAPTPLLADLRRALEAQGLHDVVLCGSAAEAPVEADVLMVKGGLPALNVLRKDAASVTVPVVAHHTDWAMLHHASSKGWLDGPRVAAEAITSFKRAGAAFTVTPFAAQVASQL